MTKKEQQRMRRLELENAELREAIDKHMRVYGDALGELVTLRATLQLVREAMDTNPYDDGVN